MFGGDEINDTTTNFASKEMNTYNKAAAFSEQELDTAVADCAFSLGPVGLCFLCRRCVIPEHVRLVVLLSAIPERPDVACSSRWLLWYCGAASLQVDLLLLSAACNRFRPWPAHF